MSKAAKLFAFFAFLAVVVAGGLAINLKPEQPNFAGDSGYQEQATTYRAGGASCEPANVERLPARERLRKADACQEAQEQHREAANGLIEARRTAVAAEAQAIYAADQASIEAWGAGIGFLTLFAAFSAAIFAERAAAHTKTGAEQAERGANAAEGQLKEARNTARQQLRAYLDFDDMKLIHAPDQRQASPDHTRARMIIQVKNFGQTPAYKVVANLELFMEVKGTRTAAVKENPIRLPLEYIAPTDHSTHNAEFDVPNLHWSALDLKRFHIIACLAVSYEDAFRRKQSIASEFKSEGIGLMSSIQNTRKAT